MRSSITLIVLGAVIAAQGSGCLYDDADRCGPGEVLDDSEVCVCAPGLMPVYRDITVLAPVNPMEPRPFSACVACDPDAGACP